MSNFRLKEITKHFGWFVANDLINLEVERGTIDGLLRKNGTEKFTLDFLHQSEKLTISNFGFWIEKLKIFARSLLYYPWY